MNVTVLYVGSSLLAPLRQAESEINRQYGVGLRIAAYNFGAALAEEEWREVERDLSAADVVFVIHVMDGENAARLLPALERYGERHHAVVVINCMPDLMRRTRMGRLDFGRMFKREAVGDGSAEGKGAGRARRLVGRVGSWMGDQARAHGAKKSRRSHTQYLKLVDHLPSLLRFVPGTGRLRDIKHYLYLFCYFLQPTPANIRAMVLYALKEYVPDERLARAGVSITQPETMPVAALYHPDAPALFESFEAYRKWYERRRSGKAVLKLAPEKTVGLLLMRPQIVSNTRQHYDGLIRAIEAEGLAVLPAISTLMDNREACEKFFIEEKPESRRRKTSARGNGQDEKMSRVSQIVSLTGFSFVAARR